jgi:hypothetical protein
MHMKQLLPAMALGLALSASAFAGDKDENSAAVDTLKSALPNSYGFEVEDVRTASDGSACITYRVGNDQNGVSRNRAVVKGDKVLRESTGNTRFAKAWNSSCAGKS